MSPDFLFRQMSWHEQLDEVLEQKGDPVLRLSLRQTLSDALTEAEREIEASVGGYLEQERYDLAAARVREWMFLNKLIAQCRAID
jgi:molecular chaperone HscB